MYQNIPTNTDIELKQQQQDNMKRLIKHEGNRWGLTTTIANAAMSVLVTVVMVVATSTPALTGVGDALVSTIGQLVQQIVYSLLMFTLPFILVARKSGLKLGGLMRVKHVRFSLSAPLVMTGLGAAVVINMLVSQFVAFLGNFNLAPESPSLDIPDSIWGIVLYIFTISALPAVVEELAFRGIVLGALRRYGNAFAVVASSLLFGLMHGNLVQIPFAAALGCVMGYLVIATDSILPAVAVHFLNNLMAAVQSVVIERCDEQTATVISYAMFVAYLVLGVVGLVLLCRTFKHPFAPIRERSVLTLGQSIKAICTSAGFITSFIYFGGSACLYLLMSSIGVS